jgi:multiple sugar transport system ATP-binding protein
MNFFNGKMIRQGDDLFVDLKNFSVKVPKKKQQVYQQLVDQEVIFGIRPEDIHNPQYAPPSIIAEPVDVHVDVTELMGNEIFLYLISGDHNFVARVDPRTRVEMGDEMSVAFNMENMHIFNPQADPENPVAIR